MRNTGDKAVPENDEALERLLEQASPRPAPSAELTEQARAAVKAEWVGVTRRHVRRRRLTTLAAAATVVLALAAAVNAWLIPAPGPVQVASLEKAEGTIYLLGEQSQLRVAEDLHSVSEGDTIVTDATGARVGLMWHGGGSLRLDEDTEIHFVSAGRIELNKGRVYFDTGNLADVELTIATPYGEVTHLGTQYMTAVDKAAASLTVSVREGRASITGLFHDTPVEKGERVLLVDSRKPERMNVTGYGPEWHWIEAVSPAVNMDGKSFYEFLLWVSRETGLELEFENDEVEELAKREDVSGLSRVDRPPREALRLRTLTMGDFEYDEIDGAIVIRRTGT